MERFRVSPFFTKAMFSGGRETGFTRNIQQVYGMFHKPPV